MKTENAQSMPLDQLAAEITANQRRNCLQGNRYMLGRAICDLERVMGTEVHDACIAILVAMRDLDRLIRESQR